MTNTENLVLEWLGQYADDMSKGMARSPLGPRPDASDVERVIERLCQDGLGLDHLREIYKLVDAYHFEDAVDQINKSIDQFGTCSKHDIWFESRPCPICHNELKLKEEATRLMWMTIFCHPLWKFLPGMMVRLSGGWH